MGPPCSCCRPSCSAACAGVAVRKGSPWLSCATPLIVVPSCLISSGGKEGGPSTPTDPSSTSCVALIVPHAANAACTGERMPRLAIRSVLAGRGKAHGSNRSFDVSRQCVEGIVAISYK